ncbi:TPA: primase-helicase family protein [Escherichia coli]
MINMPQNGPDDQVENEKDSTNVIHIDVAKEHKNPTPEELANAVEVAKQQAREREAERQRIAENAVKATEPQQLDVDALKPQIMTLDEMLTKCVWVADGERVAYLDEPYRNFKWSEFKNMNAASKTMIDVGGGAAAGLKMKAVPTTSLWRESDKRMIVDALTCAPGRPVICDDPHGRKCLNMWKKRIWLPDNETDVSAFYDDCRWLFGDKWVTVVNWIAHMIQHPEVLPHWGILHYTNGTQGVGRTTFCDILKHLLGRHCASGVNIHALLEGQFNSELAGAVLATCDEVREGDNSQYRTANRLKAMITEPVRSVNVKYGAKYEEWNACRWFVCSNHDNPLPIDEHDRRWFVIRHTAGKYADVYGKEAAREMAKRIDDLISDPKAINALGWQLATSDLSGFDIKQPPVCDDDKKRAINSAKPLERVYLDELIADWPSDIISNRDLAEYILEDVDAKITNKQRRMFEDAGMIQSQRVKADGVTTRGWIIRNQERWSAAKPFEIADELRAARDRAKVAKMASASDVMTEVTSK